MAIYTDTQIYVIIKVDILYVPLIMQQLAAWAGVGLVN
jgi:hypothetical protein